MKRIFVACVLAARFVLLAALLTPVASRAESIPAGAWKGTIGNSPVMVCFSEFGQAQYYYLRHQQGILLMSSQAPDQFGHPPDIAKSWQSGQVELNEYDSGYVNGQGKASGHWWLQAKSPTEIMGIWTAPHHGKTQPISLHKAAPVPIIEPSEGGSGCEAAYYEPIVAGLHVTFHSEAFAGHAYQTAASEHVTSFKVPAELPHAKALNQYAMKWLQNQFVLAHDCNATLSFGGFSDTMQIDSSLRPVLWTNQYLVLNALLPEIFCGDAHGFGSTSYLTWSWSTGRMVDTWGWLKGGRESLDEHVTENLPENRSGLFRLIARLSSGGEVDDVCRPIDNMSVEELYPTRQGLVFNTSFPHAIRGCSGEITVDWKQVTPYLSDEGRKVANQFLQ